MACPLEFVLRELQGHDCRMEKSAVLGKSGDVEVTQFLSKLEDAGTWVGHYGIVMAMAGRQSNALENLARKTDSCVLRARAVQALGKLDQEKTASLLFDNTVPLHVRPVVLKSMKIATHDILTKITESPSLGPWEALLLLKRSTTSPSHERLVGEWIAKLSNLTELIPTEKNGIDDRLSRLEPIYQSLSARYPDTMLRVMEKDLENNTDFDSKWFRASKELAAKRPEELLLFFKKHGQHKLAVKLLAKPLVRHAAQGTLQTLSELTHFMSLHYLKCLKKVVFNPQHRGQVLEIISRVLSDNRELDRAVLMKLQDMFLQLLKCGGRDPLISDILTDTISRSETPPMTFTEIVAKSKKHSFTFSPSLEAATRFVARQFQQQNDSRIDLKYYAGETPDPTLHEGFTAYFSDPSNKAAVEKIIKDCNADLWQHVPLHVMNPVMKDWMEDASFKTKLTWTEKAGVMSFADITVSEGPLRELLNTRDPRTRVSVLEALWSCAARSTSEPSRASAILKWINVRIRKEESDVKGPVVQCLLSEVLHVSRFSKAKLLFHLEALFTLSMTWGRGMWMSSWCTWCGRVLIYNLSTPDTRESDVTIFAKQTVKRMLDAEVLSALEIVTLLCTGARQCKNLTDVQKNVFGGYVITYAEKGFVKTRTTGSVTSHASTLNLGLFQNFVSCTSGIFFQSTDLRGFAEDLLWDAQLDIPEVAKRFLTETVDVEVFNWRFWRSMVTGAMREMQKNIGHFLSWWNVMNSISRFVTINFSNKSVLFKNPDNAAYLVEVSDVIQAVVNHGHYSLTTGYHELFKALIKVLHLVPEVEEGLLGIMQISPSVSYITYIGRPSDLITSTIFRAALDAIEKPDVKALDVLLLCDAEGYGILGTTRYKNGNNRTKKEVRFRYQRGAAADKRRTATVQKKLESVEKAKNAPDLQLERALVDLIKRLPKPTLNHVSHIRSLLFKLLAHKAISSTRLEVIKALLHVVSTARPRDRCHVFDIPDTIPEIVAFIRKNATARIADAAVRGLLCNRKKWKGRLRSMLTEGIGKLTPSELFKCSTTFQSKVCRYYPETLPTLIGESSRFEIPGIVSSCVPEGTQRFRGQPVVVVDCIHTLPPDVQRYLWDYWISPGMMDFSGVSKEVPEIDMSGYSSDTETICEYQSKKIHEAKARRIWLASALSVDLCDSETGKHPFEEYLDSIEESRERTKKLSRAQRNTKSAELLQEESISHDATQLAGEIISSMRTADRPRTFALRAVLAHLNAGLDVKQAVPALVALLRCLPTTEAAKVMRTVLERKETRAAARTQLASCCVNLVEPSDTEAFLEEMFKTDEALWVVVGDEQQEQEGDTAEPYISAKAAILSALATSPTLKAIPSLTRYLLPISEDITHKNVYIGKRILEQVLMCNGGYPLCGEDWLPVFAAKFCEVKWVRNTALNVLNNWLKLMRRDDKVVGKETINEVVQALCTHGNTAELTNMVVALGRFRKGLLSDMIQTKVDVLRASRSDPEVSLKNVLETRRAIRKFFHGEKMPVCSQECEHAVEALLSNTDTACFAFPLISCCYQSTDLEAALKHMARAARRCGVQTLFSESSCFQKLDLELLHSIRVTDFDDLEKQVYLAAVTHCSKRQGFEGQVTSLLLDPSPEVASVAFDLAPLFARPIGSISVYFG